MYQRILVATDGSELSGKAVTHALQLAKTCGAELLAITIVPRYPQSYFDGSLPLSTDEIERVEKHWSSEGQKVLDAVQVQGDAAQVKTRTLVVKSDLVSDALIDAAKEQQADLIVMASHGRKGVSRMLLGSETQQVLTHSQIPVLVLR